MNIYAFSTSFYQKRKPPLM